MLGLMANKWRGVALCALVLTLCPGCFTYYHRNAQEIPGEAHEEWAPYFLFGTIGEKEIDTRTQCGRAEVAEIENGTTFMTWFLSTVTLGIYTPREITIRCSAGRAKVTSSGLELRSKAVH
jgi:hypothetical protein